MYTIGEVSKMFDIPISTLRYYDKEGLLLGLEKNDSGIRKFTKQSLESLRVIECLKKTGMQIKDIKEFMKWCLLGNETLKIRQDMFLKRKEVLQKEIKDLEQALDMVNFKCWYYEEAIKTGSEEQIKNMKPEDMPKEVRELYKKSHS